MRTLLYGLCLALTASQIATATEPEYKSFEELAKLQSPYKTPLWQLERADVKIKIKMDKVLPSALSVEHMVMLKGKAVADQVSKMKPTLADLDEVPKIMEAADNFIALMELNSFGYCKTKFYFELGTTEEDLSAISNDTLWSLRSYHSVNESKSKEEPKVFELLLVSETTSESQVLSQVTCTRPLPLAETAHQTLGTELSDIELLKQSFGDNIEILVDTRKLKEVLTPN